MAKIIKNIQVGWNWTGDTYALQGFNLMVLPEGQEPDDASITVLALAKQISASSRTFAFSNVTLDTGVNYIPWVQAYYEDNDSEWVSSTGFTVADDGINTLTTKAEVDKNALPLIVGTQTVTTGTWLGTAPFASLQDGQQINYWLPTSGSGNATLNLTLAGGGTTGAINCYYGGSSRLTTHYGAGNSITMTYRVNALVGSTPYTGWWAASNYTDGNTYDKTRYQQYMTASEAIVAGTIIAATEDGKYSKITNGRGFTLTKPILYAESSISLNATGNNNYIQYSSATLRNNVANITLTTGKTVYVKGTISGTTFTVDATTVLTDTPTDDGSTYILLGQLYSTYQILLYTEHPMFKFVDGVLKSFAQIAVEAQATADLKSQTFTSQPSNYKIGDIWKENSTVKIATMASATYSAAHWALVGDVTGQNTANDVTYVNGTSSSTIKTQAAAGNTAQTTLIAKAPTWDTASADASAAKTAIADMSSDGKVTPVEKVQLKKEWATIAAERTSLDGMAASFSIATERTNMTNAYNALNAVLNTTTGTTNGVTNGILSNMTATTTLVGANFRAIFDDYYDKKAILQRKVSEEAKQQAVTHANSEIGKIEIGGRNLIKGTSNIPKSINAGVYYKCLYEAPNEYVAIGDYGLIVGDTLTYKVFVDASLNATFGGGARMTFYSDALGANKVSVTGNQIIAGQSGYSTITQTLTSTNLYMSIAIQNSQSGTTPTESVNYKEVKLEKGNKATDWTPAPEDVTAQIETKAKTFTTTPTIPYNSGDVWKNGTATYVSTVTRLTGSYAVGDWVKVGDVTSENTAKDTTLVGGTAASTIVSGANAGTTANNTVTANSATWGRASNINSNGTFNTSKLNGTLTDAQIASAVAWNTAKTLVSDISTDGVLTPFEKQTLKPEYDAILKEKIEAVTLATSYGALGESYYTNYIQAYNALYAGMNTMMTTGIASNSTITRSTMNGWFTNYYEKAAIFQRNINETARTIASGAANSAATANELAKAMTSGKSLYKDNVFASGLNGLSSYNGSANSNVTVTRITNPADTPTTSTHAVEIKNIGTASPGIGGFVQGLTARANAKFVVRYIAKIPVGYTIVTASNSMGTGYTDSFLTATAGTGKYEEYIRVVQCGATGTFSNGGHVYLNGAVGSASTPVVWYVARIDTYDVTDYEPFASHINADPNTVRISGSKLHFTDQVLMDNAWVNNLVANSIVATKIQATELNAGKITAGTLSADRIAAGSISGDKITANTIDATRLKIGSGAQGGYINNPRFSAWSGAYPDGTSSWSAGGISKVAVDNVFMAQFSPAAGTQQGMQLNSNYFANGIDLDGMQYFALECRFRLTVGTNPSGACFLVDIARQDASSERMQLILTEAGTTLTTNTWYVARKVFKLADANVAKTFKNVNGFLLANYSAAGDAAKTIQFASVNMFQASAQEFLAQSWTNGGTTSINGGFIATGTLSADKITTGALDASLITTGNLDAARITAGIINAGNGKSTINMNTGAFSFGSGKIAFDGTTLSLNVDSLKITNSSVATQTYASSAASTAKSEAISAAASDAKSKADTALSSAQSYALNEAKSINFGYRYAEDVIVYGDSDKYYPVIIKGGNQDVKRDIMVRRGYNEQAPADWNNATHKGGLTLKIKTNFGGWGGANYSWEVHELEEMYSRMFAGASNVMSEMAFAIFLRGGGTTGAIYHLYSDQSLTDGRYSGSNGIPISPQVALNQDLIGQTGQYSWNAPAYRTITQAVEDEIKKRKFIKLAQDTYSTVDSNQTVWGRASNINADGTINTTKLSGTVADGQIASSSAWNTAKNSVSDMMSDSKVTPLEKQNLKIEYNAILKEKAQADSLATAYSLTGHATYTTYVSHYNTLTSYLATILATMTSTSEVTRTTMETNLTNYYDYASRLSALFSSTAKTLVTTAQGTADTVKGIVSNFDSSIINANPIFLDWSGTNPDGYTMSGSTLAKVVSGNGMGNAVKYTVAASANVYLSPSSITAFPFFQYVTIQCTFKLESGTIDGAGILFRYNATANVDHQIKFKDMIAAPVLNKWYTITKVIKQASSPAGFTGYQVYPMGGFTSFGTVTAKVIQFDSMKARESTEQEINAYESNIMIADMSSDGKVTPVEKVQLKKEWATISSERTSLDGMASTFGITTERTNMTNAYNALNAVLNNTTGTTNGVTNGILSNMTSTTTLTGANFRAIFDDYYDKKAILQRKASEEAKQQAVTHANTQVNGIEIGGRNTFKKTTSVTQATGTNTRTANALNGTTIVSTVAGSVRVNNVITENGNWTFSAWVTSTVAGTLTIDFADNSSQTFAISTTRTKISKTGLVANYSSGTYHFIDIGGLPISTVTFENIKVEKGTKATDWTPAPEDVAYDIEQKADSAAVSEAINGVASSASGAQAIANAKLDKSAYDNFIKEYGEYKDALATDQSVAAGNLQAAQTAVTSIQKEMGDMKDSWTFNNGTKIEATGNGMLISDGNPSGMNMLLSQNRLSFFDGGVEVAYIADKTMKINHGIFVKSAQIGSHLISTSPTNSDITIVSFVGEG